MNFTITEDQPIELTMYQAGTKLTEEQSAVVCAYLAHYTYDLEYLESFFGQRAVFILASRTPEIQNRGKQAFQKAMARIKRASASENGAAGKEDGGTEAAP